MPTLRAFFTNMSVKIVNRQRKWDTFGTKVNGHFKACSCSSKTVEYRLKKGAGRDSRYLQ